MKILTMPQRSPEWFAARRGVITASEIGPFVFNAGKVAETARQNLIDTKLGESADGDDCPPSYEDYWMKRGTLREPEAIEAFSVHTGEETKQVGFILHDSGLLGCSPDGFEVGLEMKCPSGKIQIKRLREAVLPDEYRCQVHASMIVTGADEWHFWSWHPNIPPFHVLVKRDDFTRQLEDGLLALAAELKRQQEDLSAVWNAYFGSEVAA